MAIAAWFRLRRKEEVVKEYYSGCVGCVDFDVHSRMCDYLHRNGHVRPCPAGIEGCALKTKRPRKENSMSKAKTWDAERARALLAEGKTVKETAEAVGATKNAVSAWLYREKTGSLTTRRQAAMEKSDGPEREAGAPEIMTPGVLGELLQTAGRAFDTPGVVLLPDGEPVRGCRVELTYGSDGKAEHVEVRLSAVREE